MKFLKVITVSGQTKIISVDKITLIETRESNPFVLVIHTSGGYAETYSDLKTIEGMLKDVTTLPVSEDMHDSELQVKLQGIENMFEQVSTGVGVSVRAWGINKETADSIRQNAERLKVIATNCTKTLHALR